MDEGSPDWINVTCDSKWHLGKGCWCKENRPPFQLFLANLTDPTAEVENRVEGLHLTFGCRTIFSSWTRWQKSNQQSKSQCTRDTIAGHYLFDAHFINIYHRLPNLPSSLLVTMCEEPPLLLRAKIISKHWKEATTCTLLRICADSLSVSCLVKISS